MSATRDGPAAPPRRAQLGLGTAQLGLDYGVSNPGGRPSHAEAAAIVGAARAAGIEVFDTAPAYGDSEALLGALLASRGAAADPPARLVTKTPAALGADATRSPRAYALALRPALLASLERLRVPRVHALLEHRVERLLGAGGDEVFAALAALRAEGLVERIGASVYDGAEVDGLLARYPLDLVQAPISILDQRLVAGGQLARLAAAGVAVHARSALLQGLLVMDPAALPPGLAAAARPLAAFHAAARERGRTPLACAVGFVAGLDGVEVVVVGVQRAAELGPIVAAARASPVDASWTAALATLAVSDPDLVDPRRWKTT